MTVVVTRVVGDAGAAFVPAAVATAGGASIFDVVDVYLRAQDFTGLSTGTIRAAIGKSPSSWLPVESATRRAALCALTGRGTMPARGPGSDFAAAIGALTELLGPAESRRRGSSTDAAAPGEGGSAESQRVIVRARFVDKAFAVLHAAGTAPAGSDITELTRRFIAVERASGLERVVATVQAHRPAGGSEPLALSVLLTQIATVLQQLVAAAARLESGEATAIGRRAQLDSAVEQMARGECGKVGAAVDAALADVEPHTGNLVAALVVLVARIGAARA